MLFKKMLRDMKLHKTQFISIFLMAFLGVFFYAGIGGEWMGLRNNVDSYYNETNFANAWIYGNSFSEKNEKAVQNIEGVKETERALVIDSKGKFSNNPTISLHFVNKNQISKSYLIKGEKFSTDKDGIWIDDRFAQAHKLSTGDKMSVTFNGVTMEKKIMGTIYSPEYVYIPGEDGMTPDFSAMGYAYLSYKAFPMQENMIYNQMLITTNINDSKKIENKINTVLNGNYSVFLTRDNHTSYSMFENEIAQHKSMGSIFPMAFLAIALLTLLTTMTRIVISQRTQIGTLKALGFKKGKILFHYVSYGFWLSLAGSVLGAIVGPLTMPKLFYPSMSGFYTLPEWKSKIDISFYIMAAITVALCSVITYFACRSVLRETPAKTLRPRAPKMVKRGLLERTPIWRKLGFNSQWNLRDVVRNRARSIMAILGVLGCTALLVCAFGMNDTMKDLETWQYEDINHFKSKLTINETATKEEINSALNDTKGQAIMEGSIEVKAKGLKKVGVLTATDHVTLLKNTDENRKHINLPENGVSLTYKMAKELGVKKGDKITWHIFGNEKWVTTTVDEIYRTPTGQGISLTRQQLEKLGYTFTPTSILTAETITDKPKGISSIMNTEALMKSWDDMTETMFVMVFVLIGAASLLAIVVLYNLGILSFAEMQRELATLKVIGLKSKKLRHLLLTQNLWLSAIGFLIGIPAGKWLIDVMVESSGDSFDMITAIHGTNILLSFIITFALSILVNLMFSRKIKKIDMVGSLKGVE